MNKLIHLLIVFVLIIGCKNRKSDTVNTEKKVKINDIPVYNFNELEPLLYTNNDNIYIINFWAMWCAPCVKELPYFQDYASNKKDVELLLVSLDFTTDIETRLKPFLKKKNITEKVVLLDDPDSNTWIDKIDKNWSGAIPFTIIFNAEKRFYYERTFESLAEIEQEIHKNFTIK